MPPPGTAPTSGIIMWVDISVGGVRSYPSGYSSTDYIKMYRSILEAEDDGITDDSGSEWKDLHYHIAEFFYYSPNTPLWVSIKDDDAGPTYGDVTELQKEAGGDIHQIGAFVANTTAFSTSQVVDFHSALNDLFNIDAPAIGVLAADHSGTSTGNMSSSLADLTAQTENLVGVAIGQDGGNTGANLFSNLGYSITDMGAVLGTIASQQLLVHHSIAWPRQYRVDHGAEYQVPALANGDDNTVYTTGELDTLDDKHYIFLRNFSNLAGTYHTFGYTAVPVTNDLHTIERNRVINLSYRNLKRVFQPDLNSPIEINPDGTLPDYVLEYFGDKVEEAHEGMLNRGNISFLNYNIDPTQDVLTSQTLTISVELGAVGISKFFDIPLKFTAGG